MVVAAAAGPRSPALPRRFANPVMAALSSRVLQPVSAQSAGWDLNAAVAGQAWPCPDFSHPAATQWSRALVTSTGHEHAMNIAVPDQGAGDCRRIFEAALNLLRGWHGSRQSSRCRCWRQNADRQSYWVPRGVRNHLLVALVRGY